MDAPKMPNEHSKDPVKEFMLVEFIFNSYREIPKPPPIKIDLSLFSPNKSHKKFIL